MGRLMEEARQLNSAEAKLLASLHADPQQPKVIQHWVQFASETRGSVYAAGEIQFLGDMLAFIVPAALSASDDLRLQPRDGIAFRQ